MQVKESFQKVKPVIVGQEPLTDKKDVKKYTRKMDFEWFDKKMDTPGQLGASVKFGETIM